MVIKGTSGKLKHKLKLAGLNYPESPTGPGIIKCKHA